MTSTALADVQRLEPGAEIQLFSLDGTPLGATLLNFHGYTQVGVITWQGVAYSPWPIECEGFDLDSGQPPAPKFSVGNIDGSISALCIQFDDLVGCNVTRHRTFAQYLDAVNFPGNINPTADPTQELPLDIWKVEVKLSEDSTMVQWELASAINTQGHQLPGRAIIANFCGWIALSGYRGADCGYVGGPVADINDVPTSDPALDNCGGRLQSCKLRNWPNGELAFGSYPAAGLTRS